MKNAAVFASDEAAILNRLIKPQEKLSATTARALLKLNFDERDRARMHELAVRNQADELTPDERLELESYLRVGLMLDLIHAKARRSLPTPSRGA